MQVEKRKKDIKILLNLCQIKVGMKKKDGKIEEEMHTFVFVQHTNLFSSSASVGADVFAQCNNN
jgi:hypothetical protein